MFSERPVQGSGPLYKVCPIALLKRSSGASVFPYLVYIRSIIPIFLISLGFYIRYLLKDTLKALFVVK